MDSDSKEFKRKQKELKENRMVGMISTGPISQVFGGTYAYMMPDASLQNDGRLIMIGTASKGIIEREFQHNAQVYRCLYTRSNPFVSETDENIREYMKECSMKSRSASMSEKIGSSSASTPPLLHSSTHKIRRLRLRTESDDGLEQRSKSLGDL